MADRQAAFYPQYLSTNVHCPRYLIAKLFPFSSPIPLVHLSLVVSRQSDSETQLILPQTSDLALNDLVLLKLSVSLYVFLRPIQLPCPNGALLLDDDVPEPPPEARGGGAQGAARRARQGQQGHGSVK